MKTALDRRVLLWIVMLAWAGVSPLAAKDDAVEFNRDIRPLLSDRCFKCHGPDENQRQAGLRLDQEEGAGSETESGGIPIVPGDLSRSMIIERITTDDPDLRMPPPETGKTLSPAEIASIKAWVKSGAQWSEHWAFIPPRKPALPKQVRRWQSQNTVDLFIQKRLKAEKLQPEPGADRETLIRRVTLDLTGLPPTIKEVDDYLAD
ncbi:MAG: c-type cytochrome domain-containing protein, partial [Pirellulaceae bacterium]|nr:c-type cytochrome domain-containing protein [Pirellulaceae bacterium]